MIMEITLLIMEKSWKFVFEFLWEPWKDEIRGYIKARSKHVCSLKQLMIELSTTYGPSCVSYDTVRRWKNKIQSGWERADLLALVCGVYCEFVTFPLVSWVRCGT